MHLLELVMMIILEDYAVDVLCQDRSLDVTGLPDELQSVIESLIQGSILQQGVLWLWGSVCFCLMLDFVQEENLWYT